LTKTVETLHLKAYPLGVGKRLKTSSAREIRT